MRTITQFKYSGKYYFSLDSWPIFKNKRSSTSRVKFKRRLEPEEMKPYDLETYHEKREIIQRKFKNQIFTVDENAYAINIHWFSDFLDPRNIHFSIPINNYSFIDDNEQISMTRARDRDYQIVTKEIWDLLLYWYGGGPSVPVNVKYNSVRNVPCPVDHPMTVFCIYKQQKKPLQTYDFMLIKELKLIALKAFDFNENSAARLLQTNVNGSYVLLKDKNQLSTLGIQNEQNLFLDICEEYYGWSIQIENENSNDENYNSDYDNDNIYDENADDENIDDEDLSNQKPRYKKLPMLRTKIPEKNHSNTAKMKPKSFASYNDRSNYYQNDKINLKNDNNENNDSDDNKNEKYLENSSGNEISNSFYGSSSVNEDEIFGDVPKEEEYVNNQEEYRPNYDYLHSYDRPYHYNSGYNSGYDSNYSISTSLYNNNYNNRMLNYYRPLGPGKVGLRNLGNTCFFNSGVQCITHIMQLIRYFKHVSKWQRELNITNPLGMKGRLAVEFYKIVQRLWDGEENAIEPLGLKSVIGQFAPQFSGFDQQDAHELITFLLDGIHEDLNRCKEKPYVETITGDGTDDNKTAEKAWKTHKLRNDSVIVDLFHGQLRSRLICPNCNSTTVVFDPYLALSIPVSRPKRKEYKFLYVPMNFTAQYQYKRLPVIEGETYKDVCNRLKEKVGTDHSVVFGLMNENTFRWGIDTYYSDDTEYTAFEIIDDDDIIYIPCVLKADIKSYFYSSYVTEKIILGPILIPCEENSLTKEYLSEKIAKILSVVWDKEKPPMEFTYSIRQYAEKIKIPEKSKNPVLHKENSRVEVNPNSKESINTWETNANTTEVSTNITEVNTSTAEVNTNITEVNANTAEVSTSTILTEANTSMAKDINTEESIKKLTYNNTENESSKDPLFEIINENNKNAENNNNINENTLESKGVTNFILDNPNKSTNNAESTVNESNTNKFENDNKTITNNISLNSKNQINDEDNYSEEKPKVQIKSLNISKDLNFANLSDQIVSAYITAEGYHDPNFSSEYLVMHHVDSNPLVNEINRDIKLTLNECLNLFSVNEKLDENNQWFCPHCRKFVCADKKMDIWSVPKCLIIHLKRFITTQHSTYSSKVSTSILYDQILDMSNYVIGPQDKNSMKYQLKAVSEHMGSTYAGHYTAMALVDENFSFHQQYTYSKIQQRSNKKKWYSFNDSNVREIEDVKSVQSEDAYVLFYERIDDQQNEEEEEEETETEEKITGKSHEFTTGKSPTIHFPHPFTDSHEESSEKDTVKEEEDTNENKSDNNEKDDQQSEVYKYSHRMKLMPSQKITMNEFLQKEKLKSVLDSLEEEEEYDEDMFKRRSFNF